MQARLLPPTCNASSASSGSAGHHPPSVWVAKCLESAQRSAVLINGRHYVPLTEAQRWFEAGRHEGDTQFAVKLSASLAERNRLQGEMEHMADEALREHDEYEQGMRRLLNYALALEAEVDQARAGMQEAAQEAAREVEEKMLLQYQQMLIEYEKAHEAESYALEMGLRGQVKHLENMLRAAHEAKKQWRERALQMEEQFAQLRSLIQVGVQQATDLAAWRQAQAAGGGGAAAGPARGASSDESAGEQPPPPLHANPRIRATEAVLSADADVAAAHAHASSAGNHSSKGQHKGLKKGQKHTAARRGSPEPHTEVHFG
ncbi:hypothetical protein ABPG75_006938 [Micractinium tetrahymenae]